MVDPFRLADADPQTQRAAVRQIVREQPVLMRILHGLRELELPDALLSAGAIYNTVWNVLSGRPPLTGIKDADVAYFDATDLSYDAEDRQIRRVAAHFADLPIPVELRNQARVHLWFPQKFGIGYPQLRSSAQMLDFYASKTHAVAARLDKNDEVEVLAPFGLADLLAFRMTPNPRLDNRATHEAKSRRAKLTWPEITVVPWPDNQPLQQ